MRIVRQIDKPLVRVIIERTAAPNLAREWTLDLTSSHPVPGTWPIDPTYNAGMCRAIMQELAQTDNYQVYCQRVGLAK